VATGRELAVLRGHSSRVNSVDFDPSGARLVSGSGSYTSSENSVRLWDVDSGAELRRIDFPGNVQAVAFSPDGAHIACGVRGALLILDAELQTEARSIGRHERITCLAWAPDGGYLVSGGWDKVVRLWDPKSGEVLRVLEGHEKPISSVAVSPDSSRIVSGGYAYSESDDRTVRIWDAATGKEVACGQGLSDVVMGVAVSPDGKQVCAGLNGELRVFSLSSGAELRRIPFDSSTLTPVAYLNDGRVVSAGGYEDNKMRLWNLSRRDRYRLSSHANPIADVRFSPHGARLLTLGYDGIGVWDVSDGRPTDWHSIEQYVKRLAVSPDEARIVVVGHRCLVLDAATGETCLDLGTMDGMLGDFVSYCGNGSRILARIFQDGALLWDARSGKRLGHWPGARWVTCRPADDKAFVLISQFPTHQHSELVVVDLKRGRELRREVLEESADHLASHPRDTLVATLGNGRLVVRDYAAGRVEWSAPFEKAAERIEFSSDGGVLIVAHRSDAEDVVSVWETATGRELERLDGRGDLDALAQDYGRPSIRLMSRGTELVAETNDGRALGRMPMSNVKRIVTAPSGLTWAIQTRGGRCPQLVTLEGLPPHLADLQRIFRVP
jgi:sugar lactone lactonase YvrE